MKKLTKKLTLSKETLRNLEAASLGDVLGAATEKSICPTVCASNCAITVCGTACPRCA